MTTMPETRIALGISPDGQPIPIRLTDTGALNVSGGAGFGPGASALNGVLLMGLTPTGQFVPLAVDANGNLASSGGGVTDHGALTGLGDNDHPQYLLDGTAAGLGFMRCARGTFDPSANSAHRTIGPHGLGVTLPDKATIVNAFFELQTAFADGASNLATITVTLQSAGDIMPASVLGNWSLGRSSTNQGIWTVDEFIKLTAAREITVTVAVHALTTGKLNIFLFYVEGN